MRHQGPHQTNIVEWFVGGMVRSVRATTGRWDRHFDTEGNCTVFFDFEDGTPAIYGI
ncbi:MAG: hypothetical protein IH857_07030 [Deltaproteobacteria bacterium]|nr:hypothetical protein [Deltaproteobacteria bacterium]MCZ6622966.1 hypothetical protein [Deltaproteobacteria bacterium]